ncbi:MAG: DUF3810 family protein [Planctomycetes bacterium]|nr:DUF3810 family protein [Planctomycetota bacterium]
MLRPLLALLALILGTLVLGASPAAEGWRLAVHPRWAGVLGWLSGLVPGSAFGWGLVLLLALLVVLGRDPRRPVLARLGRILVLGLALLLLGLLGFGLLHGAERHSERLGLMDPGPEAREEALARLERALRAEVESLLQRGVQRQPVLEVELATVLAGAFGALEQECPWLEGPSVAPVRSLPEGWLASLGLAGFYSPWTGEPHVERGLPRVVVLSTAAHEWAHLRGEAREDEASLVGWQALSASEDPRARLSGHFVLLRSVWSALARTQHEAAQVARSQASTELLRLQEEVDAYWMRSRGALSGAARRTNDAYLRLAGDPRGVASYGGVVDLVLRDDWPRRIRGDVRRER